MDVKIQSVKFDADSKLVSFIEAKISRLGRFADDITSSEVILKIDKDNEHGNKVATVKLEADGSELVAERQCPTFEEAVDQAIDALKKQIEKHKNRKN